MSLQSASQLSSSVLPIALIESESGAQPSPDLSPEPSPKLLPVRAPSSTNLKVFLSTFLTIFLAELGDKTQLTTLLLAAKSHAPWIVFAGAGTALVSTSLLGVWLGCWLAQRISPKTLETAAGVLLLLISAQLFWEVFHL